ncbi:hypothetical protein F5883DRAFT_148466 [Diaporthe sp. PMI_573]|nr:hypothetical protein F5883DRAFT_148466 [Diaporthaceae sp. PMI_573]
MSRIILLSLCLNRVLPLRAGMISAAIIMYSLRGSGVQRKSLSALERGPRMRAHVWELLIHTLDITRQVGYLRRSKMTFCIGSIFLVTKGERLLTFLTIPHILVAARITLSNSGVSTLNIQSKPPGRIQNLPPRRHPGTEGRKRQAG